MGRHSLPESPGFWRSVIIAGVRYLLIAAVLAGIGFGIYKLVGNQDEPSAQPTESLPPFPTDPTDLVVDPLEETTTLPGATLPGGSPGGAPAEGPSTTTTTAVGGTASPGPTVPATPSPVAPGTTRVQVLDGSGSGIRAAKAKQKIEGAGYVVAATGATSRPYEKTTVFYQPGNEELARDVATAIGATDVLVAPANLDKTIPVAIVIGSDYPG